MRIKSFLLKKEASNAAWIIAGRVFQAAINFALGILTARYLMPSNYGLLNYAAAYTSFFMALCTLGINSIIVKEFIDQPKQEGEILGTALLLRTASSFGSALMIIALAFILDGGEPTTVLVVALCSIGVLPNVLETFRYWFQARLQSKVTAIAALCAHFVTALYKLFLIISGKSVAYFALATSLDYCLTGVFLYTAYRRNHGARLAATRDMAVNLLSKSVHYILPAIMISVYAQTDKFMLKQILSPRDVGYYGTAVSLCSSWCFVLNAVIESMSPGIMEVHRNGDLHAYQYKNRLLYTIVFWISTLVSVLFLCFGKPVVRLLYGIDFLPAAAPLKVITWYTAFSYLGVARNAWIVCENKQKYLIWIYLSAAFANVLLNIWLIPIWGTVGAAFASLIAQIATTMVTPFLIRPLRPNAIMMAEAIIFKGFKKNS